MTDQYQIDREAQRREDEIISAVRAERQKILEYLLACAGHPSASDTVKYSLRCIAGYVVDRMRLKKDAGAP